MIWSDARPDNDQRSRGTTYIEKGALLFFNGQPGVRACNIVDVTNRSAKIRTHDLPVLPTIFNLTFAPEGERNAPSLRGGVPALDRAPLWRTFCFMPLAAPSATRSY
jgi:hypothetical protein